VGRAALERLRVLVRGRAAAFAAVAVVLAAASGFLELAGEVREGDLRRVDDAILLAVAAHRSARLTSAALNVTALGSPLVLALFTGLVGLVLHRLGHARSARLLLLAAGGAAVWTHLLKGAFERRRPSLVERLVEAGGFSFPSGHSLASAAIYATAAVLVAVQARRTIDRALCAGVAAAVLAGIGASRVYLGVHYASDVLGGYAAGLAWAFALLAAAAFLRKAGAAPPDGP
jgi:undecaprenyl-diphosphatase